MVKEEIRLTDIQVERLESYLIRKGEFFNVSIEDRDRELRQGIGAGVWITVAIKFDEDFIKAIIDKEGDWE